MKSKKQLAIEGVVVWAVIFFILEVVLVWLDGSRQAWFSHGIRNIVWFVLIIIFTLINVFYDPKKNEETRGKVGEALSQDVESPSLRREANASASSTATAWSIAGQRAFNLFFNTFRKTESYDDALEAFEEELAEVIESEGKEFLDGWEFDLSVDEISAVLSAVIAQANEMKLKGKADPEFFGPLHTHIIDKLFETKSVHGEEHFEQWQKQLGDLYDN